jgi:hypothetical protein
VISKLGHRAGQGNISLAGGDLLSFDRLAPKAARMEAEKQDSASREKQTITYSKTSVFVILNEVKDLNLLKMPDSSLHSERHC